MLLSKPVPFKEALQSHEVRSLLPTTGKSRDLAKLDPAVRERALFSATVTSGELLQKISDATSSMLSGEADQATLRLGIKNLQEELGITADDPEKIGGLQDVTSTARINLQLETITDMSRGYGWWEQGQDPAVLDEWPAQELYRAIEPKGGDAAKRDWPARWSEAGGKFYDGRMIAAKDDPIWEKISRWEQPYAPFDYNSGMDVRDIARDEAIDLGVIEADTQVEPQSRDFNEDLQASPNVRAEGLQAAMEATGLGKFNSDGVFVFDQGGAS